MNYLFRFNQLMAIDRSTLGRYWGELCIPTEGDRGFRRMMTAESDDVDR
jgi:hypothetical protein